MQIKLALFNELIFMVRDFQDAVLNAIRKLALEILIHLKEATDGYSHNMVSYMSASVRHFMPSMEFIMSSAAARSQKLVCQIYPKQTSSYAFMPFQIYPGVAQFSPSFGYPDFLQIVAGQRTHGTRNRLALSLYMPAFESKLDCSVPSLDTSELNQATTYLGYLKRECKMQGQLLAGMNRIEQLRVCGAGAASLSSEKISSLMQHLRHFFKFAPDSVGVYTADVNLWHVTEQHVEALRRAGFNHVRLVLPDLDPTSPNQPDPSWVQLQVLTAIDQLQVASFRAIQVDLMVDYPHQNPLMLARTLKLLMEAGVDRIMLQNVAVPASPLLVASMTYTDLLMYNQDLDALYLQCVRRLGQAGYVHLGMDYFVLPGDPLAVAQAQGRLYLNIEGFSAQANYDVISCGIGTISAIGTNYTKNLETLDGYYDQIDGNALPIESGIALCMDDALRRAVMQMLICNLVLSVKAIELAYPITFAQYFASELGMLHALALDGLLTIDAEWLSVSTTGRLKIRSICQVFDRTLSDW